MLTRTSRRFRPAHHAVGDGGVEQLGVVACGDGEACGGRAGGEFLEGAGERAAVVVGEGGDAAFAIPAEPGNNGAMALGQFGERMAAVL